MIDQNKLIDGLFGISNVLDTLALSLAELQEKVDGEDQENDSFEEEVAKVEEEVAKEKVEDVDFVRGYQNNVEGCFSLVFYNERMGQFRLNLSESDTTRLFFSSFNSNETK